jgi:hypothetical protein
MELLGTGVVFEFGMSAAGAAVGTGADPGRCATAGRAGAALGPEAGDMVIAASGLWTGGFEPPAGAGSAACGAATGAAAVLGFVLGNDAG